MAYSIAERDNKRLTTVWKKQTAEADFFDIRFKGKKFSKEELSKDGHLTPEFKTWMEANIKDKNFDWETFCNENGISLTRDMADTGMKTFRFPEDCLYLTDDNVLGIKYELLMINWTYKVARNKNKYWNTEFRLKWSEEKGYTHKGGGSEVSMKDYDFDGEIFTKKEK